MGCVYSETVRTPLEDRGKQVSYRIIDGGCWEGGGGVVGHCHSVMHGFAAVNTS